MTPTVGCCGFPVGRARYFERLAAVELDSPFYELPRVETARRWREEAPAGFAYALRAWQVLTHTAASSGYRRLRPAFPERALSRLGHFRDTPELREAWERFASVCEALEPAFVLFETPPTFHPSADHLRDMYRFFKRPRRGRASWVWEPRGNGWDDELVRRVCRDLGLSHAVDPLRRGPAGGAARYFRLRGGAQGRRPDPAHAYTDGELRELARLCEGRAPAFVFFGTRSMWGDAGRLRELVDPLAAALRPRRRNPW